MTTHIRGGDDDACPPNPNPTSPPPLSPSPPPLSYLHPLVVQCDATVHELIRAIVKIVLLFADTLPLLPAFGAAWRSILDCLSLAMASGAGKSEVLAEAIPEALTNLLLVLQSKVTTTIMGSRGVRCSGRCSLVHVKTEWMLAPGW